MQETRGAVLSALADDSVSGPDLADRLDVSRTAIRTHVEALREAGFEIESLDEGYELVEVPAFGGAAVEFGLDAPFDVAFHETVGSTNDRARALATEGASDVVVLADEQTDGRGRLDRTWTSPSGGIWVSIVLRPDVPPACAPRYTLAAAVAVASAAREAGVPARIKWPNDVLVDGLKLAGVLTEMEAEADEVSWIVVGVGVNANVDPADVPGDVEATSLEVARSDPVDRRLFTQRLLETFHDLRTDPDAILPAWRELASTIGREVSVETPSGTVEGRALGVRDSGALVVETPDGVATVSTGDCEHLRPRGA